VKLNPSGTGVVWGTYIGGNDVDVANSVALDPSGNVWVAGTTASADFPNSQGWSQGGDFLVELNSTGSALPYAARYPNDTAAQSVSVDGAGLVHVAGPSGLVSTIAPAQTPVSRIFGIANAAAGPATGRVVPGEIVAIYGPHIGPATPGAAAVQVSIGGVNAPVIYASDSQINAIIPFGVPGPLTSVGTSSLLASPSLAAVHVVSKGVTGPDFPAAVSAAEPEVFRNPDGYAAALNQDGTLNSSSNPAQDGSVVAVWLTGVGFESPLYGEEGQVIATAQDLHCCEVTATSFALAQGDAVEVLYGGTSPGLIGGVFQMNFRLPLLPCSQNGGCQVFFSGEPYLEFTVQAGGQTSLPFRIYVTQ
jgi:uncharacterized protein (TIGR03437 family)